MLREQCIKESWIDDKLTSPTLKNPTEHTRGQEDVMQNDLIPELPPSVGYEKIVTAIDLFSRFVCPTFVCGRAICLPYHKRRC